MMSCTAKRIKIQRCIGRSNEWAKLMHFSVIMGGVSLLDQSRINLNLNIMKTEEAWRTK